MSLVLLPAVDVAYGQAVRLVQGEAGTETGYGEPLAAALAWQEAGAEWIHLVDPDCQCEAVALFEGRLTGGYLVKGTFTSRRHRTDPCC